jgi:hypothetical protein
VTRFAGLFVAVSACTSHTPAAVPAEEPSTFDVQVAQGPDPGCEGRELVFEEPPGQGGRPGTRSKASCTSRVTLNRKYQVDYRRCPQNDSNQDDRIIADFFARLGTPTWKKLEAECESRAKRLEKTVLVRETRPGQCLSEVSLECSVEVHPGAARESTAEPGSRASFPAETAECPPHEQEWTLDGWRRVWSELERPEWRTSGGCVRTSAHEGDSLDVVRAGASWSLSCGDQPLPAPWRSLASAIDAAASPPAPVALPNPSGMRPASPGSEPPDWVRGLGTGCIPATPRVHAPQGP